MHAIGRKSGHSTIDKPNAGLPFPRINGTPQCTHRFDNGVCVGLVCRALKLSCYPPGDFTGKRGANARKLMDQEAPESTAGFEQ